MTVLILGRACESVLITHSPCIILDGFLSYLSASLYLLICLQPLDWGCLDPTLYTSPIAKRMDLSALGSTLPPGLGADVERDMGDKFRGKRCAHS